MMMVRTKSSFLRKRFDKPKKVKRKLGLPVLRKEITCSNQIFKKIERVVWTPQCTQCYSEDAEEESKS